MSLGKVGALNTAPHRRDRTVSCCPQSGTELSEKRLFILMTDNTVFGNPFLVLLALQHAVPYASNNAQDIEMWHSTRPFERLSVD